VEQLSLFRVAVCLVSGCSAQVRARGWCSKHYQRWQNCGDPEACLPRQGAPVDHPDGRRTCRDCGSVKGIDDFPRDPSATRGRRASCKPCHSERTRAWYAANKDDHLPRQHARYRRDIEAIRQRDKERYERDKPKRLELAVESVHRRRALMQSVPRERGINREALRRRDGDNCCHCGIEMSFEPLKSGQYNPIRATLEHLVALSKGGSHTWDNVALACWQCNVRKNAKSLDEWLDAGRDVA
jgi:5-methylcytosine-specific restriction endonuclease McrA